MTDSKEFKNLFMEIFPSESELKKQNGRDNVATFLDINITIKQGQFPTGLYDKRDGFDFSIVRLPSNGPIYRFIDDLIAINDSKEFDFFHRNLPTRIRVKERKCSNILGYKHHIQRRTIFCKII